MPASDLVEDLVLYVSVLQLLQEADYHYLTLRL